MQQTIAITNINLFIVVKLPIIKIIACYPYMGIACYPCMGKFKRSIYGLTVCLPYSCCFNVIQLSITSQDRSSGGLQGLATAIGMGSLDMEKLSKKQGKYPLISPDEF